MQLLSATGKLCNIEYFKFVILKYFNVLTWSILAGPTWSIFTGLVTIVNYNVHKYGIRYLCTVIAAVIIIRAETNIKFSIRIV